MGHSPIYAMDADERLCFDAALDQWNRSLKRPDLQEVDRVKGALLAYMRQAFALRLIAEHKCATSS
jgi:hypothetical protein